MSVNHASFWSPLTKSFERTMTLLLLASRRRSRSLFNWLDLVLGFAARGGSEKRHAGQIAVVTSSQVSCFTFGGECASAHFEFLGVFTQVKSLSLFSRQVKITSLDEFTRSHILWKRHLKPRYPRKGGESHLYVVSVKG
ncbi:hypothetical protein IGI04_036545 [Brassica rapa subsp. trilocularis]|uniref:Uncharacterized protein n=1 Tax=Brassica rapa subsp. trilocularis TaxID=1813537 RepID=A0ABQ7LHH2_BRACM|nr:hypothetical protein IGI04_036545 [Brassica rapa subsp. trilocularis]